MICYGKSAKTLAGKDIGSRNHHRFVCLSHPACRLLPSASITGYRNCRYTNNSWGYPLPDLEAQKRLQLVRKGGSYD